MPSEGLAEIKALMASDGGGSYEDLSDRPTNLYLKDTATPAHYWKLVVSTLGVIMATDSGTTAPTDGVIGTG